ncbi:hypothetical protein [Microvirga tunisiensis]|uniref:hypothetical protein n=1 Tax=Microvirga tunisiensis TaxID=2108360 RepID=UPI00129CFC01|nr:hypothetical protein [Microvirga tunisiensis]
MGHRRDARALQAYSKNLRVTSATTTDPMYVPNMTQIATMMIFQPEVRAMWNSF